MTVERGFSKKGNATIKVTLHKTVLAELERRAKEFGVSRTRLIAEGTNNYLFFLYDCVELDEEMRAEEIKRLKTEPDIWNPKKWQ